MKISKEAQVEGIGTPEAGELALINALARRELGPDEVYTFALRLCDNDIDRDFERFDDATLDQLAPLFVGVSGVFDHQWSAKGQTARIYRTEMVDEPAAATADGRPCRWIKGWAYMMRTPENASLIAEIDGGIKREVSVGCSVRQVVCSVCGQELDRCGHEKGRRYGGQLCHGVLTGAADAYEWSFVAVPAQRKAGVIKSFVHEQSGELKQLLASHPGCLRQWEELEKQAQLGRSYMDGMRKELIRLAGLTDETMDLTIFAKMAEKMEEDELLELTKVYKRRMEEIYPPQPQLKPQNAAPCGEEDRAFLI